mmetsp:Transcript_20901/g.65770  ORF Transcript_20901/g.65770 Transcript_20901/m.65770 type:complete len:1336 (+) Transcript_20901:517-4524(+)
MSHFAYPDRVMACLESAKRLSLGQMESACTTMRDVMLKVNEELGASSIDDVERIIVLTCRCVSFASICAGGSNVSNVNPTCIEELLPILWAVCVRSMALSPLQSKPLQTKVVAMLSHWFRHRVRYDSPALYDALAATITSSDLTGKFLQGIHVFVSAGAEFSSVYSQTHQIASFPCLTSYERKKGDEPIACEVASEFDPPRGVQVANRSAEFIHQLHNCLSECFKMVVAFCTVPRSILIDVLWVILSMTRAVGEAADMCCNSGNERSRCMSLRVLQHTCFDVAVMSALQKQMSPCQSPNSAGEVASAACSIVESLLHLSTVAPFPTILRSHQEANYGSLSVRDATALLVTLKDSYSCLLLAASYSPHFCSKVSALTERLMSVAIRHTATQLSTLYINVVCFIVLVLSDRLSSLPERTCYESLRQCLLSPRFSILAFTAEAIRRECKESSEHLVIARMLRHVVQAYANTARAAILVLLLSVLKAAHLNDEEWRSCSAHGRVYRDVVREMLSTGRTTPDIICAFNDLLSCHNQASRGFMDRLLRAIIRAMTGAVHPTYPLHTKASGHLSIVVSDDIQNNRPDMSVSARAVLSPLPETIADLFCIDGPQDSHPVGQCPPMECFVDREECQHALFREAISHFSVTCCALSWPLPSLRQVTENGPEHTVWSLKHATPLRQVSGADGVSSAYMSWRRSAAAEIWHRWCPVIVSSWCPVIVSSLFRTQSLAIMLSDFYSVSCVRSAVNCACFQTDQQSEVRSMLAAGMVNKNRESHVMKGKSRRDTVAMLAEVSRRLSIDRQTTSCLDRWLLLSHNSVAGRNRCVDPLDASILDVSCAVLCGLCSIFLDHSNSSLFEQKRMLNACFFFLDVIDTVYMQYDDKQTAASPALTRLSALVLQIETCRCEGLAYNSALASSTSTVHLSSTGLPSNSNGRLSSHAIVQASRRARRIHDTNDQSDKRHATLSVSRVSVAHYCFRLVEKHCAFYLLRAKHIGKLWCSSFPVIRQPLKLPSVNDHLHQEIQRLRSTTSAFSASAWCFSANKEAQESLAVVLVCLKWQTNNLMGSSRACAGMLQPIVDLNSICSNTLQCSHRHNYRLPPFVDVLGSTKRHHRPCRSLSSTSRPTSAVSVVQLSSYMIHSVGSTIHTWSHKVSRKFCTYVLASALNCMSQIERYTQVSATRVFQENGREADGFAFSRMVLYYSSIGLTWLRTILTLVVHVRSCDGARALTLRILRVTSRILQRVHILRLYTHQTKQHQMTFISEVARAVEKVARRVGVCHRLTKDFITLLSLRAQSELVYELHACCVRRNLSLHGHSVRHLSFHLGKDEMGIFHSVLRSSMR